MTDAENSTATTAENDKPTGGGVQGSATPEAKTFTQDDVNRMTGEARKDGRTKAMADFLKELGIEKPEDAKSLIAAAKAKEDADKSEAQKATDRADAADKKRIEVEQKLADYEAGQVIAARNAAIVAKATGEKADIPADVLSWLKDNAAADLDALKADESGKFDDKALKALVEKVRTARPKWFGTSNPGSPSISGGRAIQPGKDARQSDAAATSRALRNRV